MTAVRTDLHTHSVASPDGGLTRDDYRNMLESGGLDYIAVTDHDTADFALELQRELGDKIIVGEEIRTTAGEIIGLYLQEAIPPMLSPAETIAAIRAQGGLVYIPHPFESVRQGMSAVQLDIIAGDVDMIEVHNGRAAFQNRGKQAYVWAARHGCAGVASSDSHGRAGWGRTYTTLSANPTRDNLLGLLQAAEYQVRLPSARAVLYPKANRIKKKIRKRYGRLNP